jgi:hypothetical protein
MKNLYLQTCQCGHTLMLFNKASDTWDCSQCNTQRADHTTPYWQIRRVPNTRGSRFALYEDTSKQANQESKPSLVRSNKVDAWCADLREATSVASHQEDTPSSVAQEPSIGDIRAYVITTVNGSRDPIVAVARFCGVGEGMRLSNTPRELCDQLHLFFSIIDPYVRNARNKSRPWGQDMVASALNRIGVLRADGTSGINNSNISNTIRKAVFERGTSCYKPRYQGKNWMSF